MKTFFTSLFLLCFLINSYAQAIYKTIDSYKLDGTRELKIQLPRNYDPEAEKSVSVGNRLRWRLPV